MSGASPRACHQRSAGWLLCRPSTTPDGCCVNGDLHPGVWRRRARVGHHRARSRSLSRSPCPLLPILSLIIVLVAVLIAMLAVVATASAEVTPTAKLRLSPWSHCCGRCCGRDYHDRCRGCACRSCCHAVSTVTMLAAVTAVPRRLSPVAVATVPHDGYPGVILVVPATRSPSAAVAMRD